MNRHVAALLARLENRYSHDSVDMPMSEWISLNTTIGGRPYSYNRYPFQRRIADDMHPNLDCQKCSQVGLTEVQIRKSLGFLVRNQGTSGLLTFPDEKTFKKNSDTRIRPIVDNDKVFNTEQDDGATRSRHLVQLGKSYLHVVMATESDATSTPADFVMNDEVDLSDQAILGLFNSRLQNSDFKINQRFSTPTHVGYGISLSYQASDQHELMVRCDACRRWQLPHFTRDYVRVPGLSENVGDLTEIDDRMVDGLDILNAVVVCKDCEAPLDLGREDNREWVPKFPGRQHARGYRVRPFGTSRLTPSYIITQLLKYKQRDFLRGFHNTVLGDEFTESSARLNDVEIAACFTGQMTPPAPNNDAPHSVGIDMGASCHITVGRGTSAESCQPVLFEVVPSERVVQRVEEICQLYRVVTGAVDRMPYTPTANDIFRVSKGAILPVQYTGKVELKLMKNAEDVITHAQADRTQMIDQVVRQIRMRNLMMSGYGQYKTVITEHLKDMVRNEEPEKAAEWIKLTGQDHFFHALAFLLIGFKVRTLLELQSQDEIRSNFGVFGVSTKGVNTNILGVKDKTLDRPFLLPL